LPDITALVADIQAKLGISTPEKELEIRSDITNKVNYVLTKYPWFFLYNIATITTIAGQNDYALPDDFLEPHSLKTIYGPVEIKNHEWMAHHFPDPSVLTGYPQFALFRGGRIVRLIPNTQAVPVELSYSRVGAEGDLDYDPGFYEVLKNAVLGGQLQDPIKRSEAVQTFYFDVKAKAVRLAQKFGIGDSFIIPDKSLTGAREQMKSYLWS